MRIPWLCTVAILFCLSDPHSFSQTSDPQTELQLGIAAYEKAAYKEAVDHLKRAVLLDPSLTIAHLYLANTYSDLYCTTCEFDSDAGDTNEQRRVLVLEEYNKVLELDSSNTKALNSMANLHYRSAKFDEAERYYRKTIEVDASNSEALYTLAVIEWHRSYVLRMEKRAQLKFSPRQPLIDSPACHEIRKENLARVEEGISLLTRIPQVFNIADGMAYMGLLYRERADIQCDDRPAYEDDIKTAQSWAHRGCEARQNPDSQNIPWSWPPSPPPPPLKSGNSCFL